MMDQDDWDMLNAADEAAGRLVPEVVMRHRSAGILTWALMHQMEREVLEELEANGGHSALILNMIRSAPSFGYPRDERPVSFSDSSVAPVIFLHVEKAWRMVH